MEKSKLNNKNDHLQWKLKSCESKIDKINHFYMNYK